MEWKKYPFVRVVNFSTPFLGTSKKIKFYHRKMDHSIFCGAKKYLPIWQEIPAFDPLKRIMKSGQDYLLFLSKNQIFERAQKWSGKSAHSYAW